MVKIEYNRGGTGMIEFDGTKWDILIESDCLVHELYKALYKQDESMANTFKETIIKGADRMFSVDDKSNTKVELSDEEIEELKKRAESLHKFLDVLDSALNH